MAASGMENSSDDRTRIDRRPRDEQATVQANIDSNRTVYRAVLLFVEGRHFVKHRVGDHDRFEWKLRESEPDCRILAERLVQMKSAQSNVQTRASEERKFTVVASLRFIVARVRSRNSAIKTSSRRASEDIFAGLDDAFAHDVTIEKTKFLCGSEDELADGCDGTYAGVYAAVADIRVIVFLRHRMSPSGVEVRGKYIAILACFVNPSPIHYNAPNL